MTAMKRVSLYEYSHYGDDKMPEDLGEFIAWVGALYQQIPEEFRSSAKFDFDAMGNDYDYSRGEISIYYERPYTAKEIAEHERQSAASRLDEAARERATLAALLKKYGAA